MGTYRITLSEGNAVALASPVPVGMRRLIVQLEDPEYGLGYRLGIVGPADLLDDATTPEQQQRVCAWIADGVLTADRTNQPTKKRLSTVLPLLNADADEALAGAKTLLSVMETASRLKVARGEVTLQGGSGLEGRATFDWPGSSSVGSLAAMAQAERRQQDLDALYTSPSFSSKRPRI